MSEENDARADAPFAVIYTEPAEAEVADAYEWLSTFGGEVAERWLDRLAAAVRKEANLQAAVTLRRPVAADSPPGRPLSLLLFRTGGRRGSAWHIAYELIDSDGNGQSGYAARRPRSLCGARQ